MKHLLIILSMISALYSCTQEEFVPKPKGYNRIDIKASKYIDLPDSLPYSFQYSNAAKILKDSSWISERYWIDLYYPELGANVQVTYKPVDNNRKKLEEYLKDSYKLTAKHNVKAYAIDETVIELNGGMKATLMELSGEVPSQFQFHVTDSAYHFMRGALYFKTSTQNDSLKPVIDHVKQDMLHMLMTLKWQGEE